MRRRKSGFHDDVGGILKKAPCLYRDPFLSGKERASKIHLGCCGHTCVLMLRVLGFRIERSEVAGLRSVRVAVVAYCDHDDGSDAPCA